MNTCKTDGINKDRLNPSEGYTLIRNENPFECDKQ